VRFLIDAQLPPALVKHLAMRGHVGEHVNDIGIGGATDLEIWLHARASGAVIVTKDEDFATLTRREPTGPQVIWIRLGNTTNAALWTALGPLLAEIIEALESGERLIEIA
jgi:predicted nuclease of predicted toxin-antitoxin system